MRFHLLNESKNFIFNQFFQFIYQKNVFEQISYHISNENCSIFS